MAGLSEGRARDLGNLGPDEQNRSLRWGLVALSLALAVAALAIKVGVGRPVRVLLFVPFFVGALGVTQGLFKTSVQLALRGMRVHGVEGPVNIPRREERRELRAQGVRVLVFSVVAAMVATGLFVFVR